MATIPAIPEALNDQHATQVGKLLHALVTNETATSTVTLANLQDLVQTGMVNARSVALSAGTLHTLALTAVGGKTWQSAGQSLSADPADWTEEQYRAAGL